MSCLPCCICSVDKSWASLFRASGLEHFVSSRFRHKQNTVLFNCQQDLKWLTLCCFFFFFFHSNYNGEAEEKTRNRERTSVHSVSGQPQCSLWIWRQSSFYWGLQELRFSYLLLWVATWERDTVQRILTVIFQGVSCPVSSLNLKICHFNILWFCPPLQF